LLVTDKTLIDVGDLAEQVSGVAPIPKEGSASLEGFTLDELEKQSILLAIEKYAGNLSQVAAALGISRAALYRRLEKYSIQTYKS
jgi:two-component system NtrC family response regulator